MLHSAVLAVDSIATIITATQGTVRYDWTVANTATQGEYYGWWKATLASGKILTTPEFRVLIDAHASGEAVTTGEITEQARQIMPVTWDALSKDVRYGDRMLQTRVSYVKYKLFATVVDPTLEATIYNPLVQDYVAKVTALQIIPAGIDYWMEQHASISTTGTAESVAYPDRIAHLQKLQEWLLREISDLTPELPGLLTVRRKGRGPKVGNALDLLTPNPQEYEKLFDEHISRTLPKPFSGWGR